MRQKDYTLSRCYHRSTILGIALRGVSKRNYERNNSSSTGRRALVVLTSRDAAEQQQVSLLLDRSNRIAATDFLFNFNRFSDAEALQKFRFRVADIGRLVSVLSWPDSKTHTGRNRYGVTPILATCVVLRRMAVPDRWIDIQELFGKHSSQLSEIFWEAIEAMVSKQGHLLLNPIPTQYLQDRAELFASVIQEKGAALPNCIGFIDGTVIGVARPKGHMSQLVVYNGHKRKHSLKYQAVNTPDGLLVHAHGPIEGRRHDWLLYLCSGIESNLTDSLSIGGTQYVIYGDSGYNWRAFMEVPFQGSHLNEERKAFNTSMSRVRRTVEWIFKEVKLYFPTVDMKRKMKLWESPVGLLYIATMLMCNFRNCIYPNQISTYFQCPPPSLDDYLSQRGMERSAF